MICVWFRGFAWNPAARRKATICAVDALSVFLVMRNYMEGRSGVTAVSRWLKTVCIFATWADQRREISNRLGQKSKKKISFLLVASSIFKNIKSVESFGEMCLCNIIISILQNKNFQQQFRIHHPYEHAVFSWINKIPPQFLSLKHKMYQLLLPGV